ncbi:MAG: hypothetical protein WAX69_02265 [Victivallales bacterium]
MNTRKKSIKAANAYILRDAGVASPEEYPQLCRIFDDIKKRNPCGKSLTLMVGKAYSGGLAIWHSKRSGTILLDRKEISTMDEKEIRFLLGHEMGHFLIWKEADCKQEQVPLTKNNIPSPLSCLFGRISREIYCDIAGVAECGSAFVAGSNLSDGDEEMHDLYNSPCGPLPEKFFSNIDLAVRIQALGLLAKSEYLYEITDAPLFAYGKGLMTADEYFKHMDRLFDPFMNFTDEDGRTLGAFIGASMFIAGCRSGDVRWHRELDRLGDFGDPMELLAYASKDQAYDRILSVADNVRNIKHPLKHLAWNAVWDVTYREWDDDDEAEKFDGFIDYIDGRDKTAA